jgi:hypothetical protein
MRLVLILRHRHIIRLCPLLGRSDEERVSQHDLHATLQGCDVKTWLAAALAQPSTARAFETLAGNPKRRSQMGLMLPTARTLRDLYKTEIAAVASGRNFMASNLVWIWATIQADSLYGSQPHGSHRVATAPRAAHTLQLLQSLFRRSCRNRSRHRHHQRHHLRQRRVECSLLLKSV